VTTAPPSRPGASFSGLDDEKVGEGTVADRLRGGTSEGKKKRWQGGAGVGRCWGHARTLSSGKVKLSDGLPIGRGMEGGMFFAAGTFATNWVTSFSFTLVRRKRGGDGFIEKSSEFLAGAGPGPSALQISGSGNTPVKRGLRRGRPLRGTLTGRGTIPSKPLGQTNGKPKPKVRLRRAGGSGTFGGPLFGRAILRWEGTTDPSRKTGTLTSS